jgi:hypothetical protein
MTKDQIEKLPHGGMAEDLLEHAVQFSLRSSGYQITDTEHPTTLAKLTEMALGRVLLTTKSTCFSGKLDQS